MKNCPSMIWTRTPTKNNVYNIYIIFFNRNEFVYILYTTQLCYGTSVMEILFINWRYTIKTYEKSTGISFRTKCCSVFSGIGILIATTKANKKILGGKE